MERLAGLNGSKPMNLKDEITIAQIYCSDFPDPHNNPRIKKARALYELIKDVPPKTRVVELGTQHGCGATALAFGLREAGRGEEIVYTIDDYRPRYGWVGEPYGPTDKAIFYEKTLQAESNHGIFLINHPADSVIKTWHWPIGLLFWDFWGERLREDFLRWERFIVPDGIFAVHVPGDPPKWGARELFDEVIETGRWAKHKDYPGGFVFTIKKVVE